MFDSVRTRLTLWYAGVLALALIAFAVLVYYAAASIFYARQDELLRSTAETVASAYVQELEEEQSVARANDVVLAQMIFPNRYVEVVDATGQVVAWSSNLAGHQLTIPVSTLSEARERGGLVDAGRRSSQASRFGSLARGAQQMGQEWGWQTHENRDRRPRSGRAF